MHHDADEVFEHFKPGLSLRDAIEEADDSGYNALNFEEFVFLPERGVDYSGRNFYKEMLRYYFFEPGKLRKNAAWKRSMGFSNVSGAGHKLAGDGLSFFPTNHLFRHYIALSHEHAQEKYVGRAFGNRELGRGWHHNRISFTAENLTIPDDSPYLFKLESYDAKNFHKEKPTSKHYWEW